VCERLIEAHSPEVAHSRGGVHVLPRAKQGLGIIEGALFVETLLGIHGIGRFTFLAVTSRDYDVILATTVIFSTVFVLSNLARRCAP